MTQLDEKWKEILFVVSEMNKIENTLMVGDLTEMAELGECLRDLVVELNQMRS